MNTSQLEVGYHASHEQFAPSELLILAEQAEGAGFDAILSSDHLAPWTEDGGQSGFAWAWLGAAMTRTRLPYAVVTAPGVRYHPAVIAQAIATLAEMAPGRLAPALGSGQALNEHVTGRAWPEKPERNARLAECADVIRRLLHGEHVDHEGRVRVRDARLHTLPPVVPPLFGAALTPATATEVGEWADGLITVDAPTGTVHQVIEGFRSAAGRDLPVHVQMHLSWAGSEEQAREQAVQNWRTNALPPEQVENLRTPADFDEAARSVTAEDLEDSVLMTSAPARIVERLGELAALGVERVHLHHVGRDQSAFIEMAASDVLSRLR